MKNGNNYYKIQIDHYLNNLGGNIMKDYDFKLKVAIGFVGIILLTIIYELI